jgi:hypothetical protein
MAEIPGIASSVITLASCADTLRQLHRDFRNAPSLLEVATEEIDTVLRFINLIDQSCRKNEAVNPGVEAHLHRCADKCQAGAKKIRLAAEKIKRATKVSKAFGRLDCSSKTQDLRDMRKELQATMHPLEFAFLLFME